MTATPPPPPPSPPSPPSSPPEGEPPADRRDATDGDAHDAGADKGTGFLAVLQSVAAAGIGVQSSKNRKRDFDRGKPLHFIIGGLIGTALFLLAVWLFVNVLISTA